MSDFILYVSNCQKNPVKRPKPKKSLPFRAARVIWHLFQEVLTSPLPTVRTVAGYKVSLCNEGLVVTLQVNSRSI